MGEPGKRLRLFFYLLKGGLSWWVMDSGLAASRRPGITVLIFAKEFIHDLLIICS